MLLISPRIRRICYMLSLHLTHEATGFINSNAHADNGFLYTHTCVYACVCAHVIESRAVSYSTRRSDNLFPVLFYSEVMLVGGFPPPAPPRLSRMIGCLIARSAPLARSARPRSARPRSRCSTVRAWPPESCLVTRLSWPSL